MTSQHERRLDLLDLTIGAAVAAGELTPVRDPDGEMYYVKSSDLRTGPVITDSSNAPGAEHAPGRSR